MGSLIIKNIKYSGNKYYYDSPELSEGINIILGDNGSGKSTFAYFIEFAFGGKIKPFSDDNSGGRYTQILSDTNNYVEVTFYIDENLYKIKRFLNGKEILIQSGDDENIISFPINRHKDYASHIFSDWLLEKLDIPVFELNLGTSKWYFNFSDLFRLLNYDQNTEPNKIFKAPSADNFISDSAIIRKSIFEILLGISSADYFKMLDEAKASQRKRDNAKALWENFIRHNNYQKSNLEELEQKKQDLEKKLEITKIARDQHLNENTSVNDKLGELSDIQGKLVNFETENSRNRINKNYIEIERNKVTKLYKGLLEEIHQIEKIIFTHSKLDLFSMEVCPFCMSEHLNKKEGHCICGSEFQEDVYEKFVYDSSEYQDILNHKQKSIKSIESAIVDIDIDIKYLDLSISKNNNQIAEYSEKLKTIIETSHFAGNSTLVDEFTERIFKIKSELFEITNHISLVIEESTLAADYKRKDALYISAVKKLTIAKKRYAENNLATIEAFNDIYSILLKASSYKSKHAVIDEDYMPFIDRGAYRANSSDVPKRLMYYFTILCLSLKFDAVKHPRFLLIDTPEDSGIDEDALNLNLELLEKAIELAHEEKKPLKPYQVILTTGYGKFPESFKHYVIETFSEKDGNFILKSTNTN